jgi:hypothetical protein
VGLLQKVLRKSPLLKTVGVFIPPRNVQILGVEGAGGGRTRKRYTLSAKYKSKSSGKLIV